ncbi:MAG: LacI family DNA-binding transcriptional regulator [Mesorhizobium sp.]
MANRAREYLAALAELGGSAGNVSLRKALQWRQQLYDNVKIELVAKGAIVVGRGGSVALPDRARQRDAQNATADVNHQPHPSATPARRPTLADVAKLAGTSTAVASYVVNNGPRSVSPAKRALVEEAIASLNYRRNPLASALMVGRSNLVGLLVPDSSNAFFSELSREFEREGKARGFLTLLGNTAYDQAAEQDYERTFADLRPRGIFVTSINGHAEDLDDCPRIYVHSAPPGATDPSIQFDDIGGGREATRHLIAHGYQDIHCVAGPDDFGPSGKRERGWQLAMGEAGLSVEHRMHRVSFGRLEAEVQIGAILSSATPPRAIFATTDEQALAALRAASTLGKKVPQDVAIVGFDGIREAMYGNVRLTTFVLPLRELAVRAFEVLDAWNSGDKRSHIISGSLVVGETCGAHHGNSS